MTPEHQVGLDADCRALAATLAGVCPPAPHDPLLASLQRSMLARRVAEPALTGRALLAAVADEHPTASARFLRWLDGGTGVRQDAAGERAVPVPPQDLERRAS